MMLSRFRVHGRHLGLAALLAGASPLFAAPSLVSSTPAANAAVVKPNRIDIQLSEKVPAKGASIDLTMTAMPGMAHHGPMRITGAKLSVAADGQSIAAVLPRPLPAGTYAVAWKAGGGQGQFSFTVK